MCWPPVPKASIGIHSPVLSWRVGMVGGVLPPAGACREYQLELDSVSRRPSAPIHLKVGEAAVVGDTCPADLDAFFPREVLYTREGASRVLRNFELLGAAVGFMSKVGLTSAEVGVKVST